MKKTIIATLCLAALALGARAQDIKPAVEALTKYKYGESRLALNPITDAIRNAGGDPAKTKPIADALVAAINGECGVEGKRIALRALGPIAGADAVAAIAKQLADPAVADTAQWALERITDPAAGRALLDALASAPADKKIVYVQALGWRREPAAAGELAKLITDKDEALALEAMASLARIDASAAGAALEGARAAAKGAQRVALNNLALRTAEIALAKKDTAGAVKIYEALSSEAETGAMRGAALNGLVKAEPAKALERVLKALTDKDPQLVRIAGAFVRDLPGDDATKAFAGLLAEAPVEQKTFLIEQLTDRGDPSARQAILDAANSADDAGKLAAVRALGRIGNEQDTATLVMGVVALTGDQKRAAQTSLNTLPGAGVNKALVDVAKGKDPKMASVAITALAERRAKETRPDLMALAHSPEASLRGDAYAALEALGEQDDLPTLLTELNEGKVEAAELPAAQKTIAAISNRIPAADKRAAAAVKALGEATTPAARVAIVQILGNIPTAESLDALRKAVGNDDAGVSLAAVQAISAWPNGAVMSDLKGLMADAKAPEARAAAISGYVRLVREAKLPAADALAAYEEALKAAQTPAEKKPVIAALATVPSKHALELLEGLKGDPALATDASSGIVSVARLVSGSDPAFAKDKIAPYAADDQPEAIKKPAKAALGLIDAFGDYITAWQVSGPYFQAGKDARELFEMQFAPENAPKDAKWSIAPMANARPDSPELKPWTVDLGAIFEDQERVAYLRTSLDSAKDQELVLELGTNDGCKVWLNGKQIHAWKEGRVLTPGQDKVPVTLKQGKNELMIAVYQQGGGWAACARLATKDGKPAGDVKATIE